MSLPKIAITTGDPAGVGPELALKMLVSDKVRQVCLPFVIGDCSILKACGTKLGLKTHFPIVAPEQVASTDLPAIIDLKTMDLSSFVPGKISAATGNAGYRYVNTAIDLLLNRSIDAVTTGPINKEAMSMAGIRFPGHTEIFASRTNSDRSCMMQYSDIITCSFVTVHVGYAQVPQLLTTQRIVDVIELTYETLKKVRRREPKLVVCGLNPHAGEHGLFGEREEERIIEPAVVVAKNRGWNIEGPIPPDTAFLPWKRESTDGYVCMYHDQGHIPVKALAFDECVNTTLGIPIIRTSVDHGTALDIAWQGIARPNSMLAAIKLAAKLSQIS